MIHAYRGMKLISGPFLAIILLVSITTGAGLAYDADSRDEAVYTYDDYVEEEGSVTEEEDMNFVVENMIENGMKTSLWIASVVGYWLYPHTSWLPEVLVASVLKVLALVPLAWILWKLVQHVGQLYGEPA